jgi:hypothetical protein
MTVAIAFFALGGTYVYTKFASSVVQQRRPYQVELATDVFSLELTRTFTAIPLDSDPISKSLGQSSSEMDSAAILVLLKGEPILIKLSEVAANESVVLEKIPGVEIGQNEIFVKARLRPPAAGELAAMQVRILAHGRIIAESVFTSYPGSPWVYGTVSWEVTSVSETENRD